MQAAIALKATHTNMKPDNIHYSLNKILSYNKVFNFVVSAREAGKTTAV